MPKLAPDALPEITPTTTAITPVVETADALETGFLGNTLEAGLEVGHAFALADLRGDLEQIDGTASNIIPSMEPGEQGLANLAAEMRNLDAAGKSGASVIARKKARLSEYIAAFPEKAAEARAIGASSLGTGYGGTTGSTYGKAPKLSPEQKAANELRSYAAKYTGGDLATAQYEMQQAHAAKYDEEQRKAAIMRGTKYRQTEMVPSIRSSIRSNSVGPIIQSLSKLPKTATIEQRTAVVDQYEASARSLLQSHMTEYQAGGGVLPKDFAGQFDKQIAAEQKMLTSLAKSQDAHTLLQRANTLASEQAIAFNAIATNGLTTQLQAMKVPGDVSLGITMEALSYTEKALAYIESKDLDPGDFRSELRAGKASAISTLISAIGPVTGATLSQQRNLTQNTAYNPSAQEIALDIFTQVTQNPELAKSSTEAKNLSKVVAVPVARGLDDQISKGNGTEQIVTTLDSALDRVTAESEDGLPDLSNLMGANLQNLNDQQKEKVYNSFRDNLHKGMEALQGYELSIDQKTGEFIGNGPRSVMKQLNAAVAFAKKYYPDSPDFSTKVRDQILNGKRIQEETRTAQQDQDKLDSLARLYRWLPDEQNTGVLSMFVDTSKGFSHLHKLFTPEEIQELGLQINPDQSASSVHGHTSVAYDTAQGAAIKAKVLGKIGQLQARRGQLLDTIEGRQNGSISADTPSGVALIPQEQGFIDATKTYIYDQVEGKVAQARAHLEGGLFQNPALGKDQAEPLPALTPLEQAQADLNAAQAMIGNPALKAIRVQEAQKKLQELKTKPPADAGEEDMSFKVEDVQAGTDPFVESIKAVENAPRIGFKDGKWTPIKITGTESNIGYGHYLKPGAKTVTIGGKKYPLSEGITEEQANQLLAQDLNKAEGIAKASVDKHKPSGMEWSALKPGYRDILTNIAFNVGKLGTARTFTWKKLLKAMSEDDLATIKKEMVTSATMDGKKVKLTKRAAQIFEGVGLSVPETVEQLAQVNTTPPGLYNDEQGRLIQVGTDGSQTVVG